MKYEVISSSVICAIVIILCTPLLRKFSNYVLFAIIDFSLSPFHQDLLAVDSLVTLRLLSVATVRINVTSFYIILER